jgi:hypothetical protein
MSVARWSDPQSRLDLHNISINSRQPAEGDAASPISTVDGSASSRTGTAGPATCGLKTVCARPAARANLS